MLLDRHIHGYCLGGITINLASCAISTQIECDMVQPSYEFGSRPKFSDVEVGPDEDVLRQFEGVSFVGNVAKYETEDPFLVSINQGIQCSILASLKRSNQGEIRIFESHEGLLATVHLVQLISREVKQLLVLFGGKNFFHFENVL